MGILTALSVPWGKKVKSTSGCTCFMYSLNARESRANKCLSINSRIVFTSRSPLTDVIMYFKRVDNSGDTFLLNFFKPSNSWFIFLSSELFKILNVNLLFYKLL